MDLDTNLRYLKRSTKTPKPGDVFAMLPPDGKYLFGRVIDASIDRGRAPMPNSNLLYIYSVRSESQDPALDELTPGNLLIPPLFTNKKGWTKGIYKTVKNVPLAPEDRLSQHCFWSPIRQSYLDLDMQPLDEPVEPCGSWGLESYRMIDDHISDALGIGRAPVE